MIPYHRDFIVSCQLRHQALRGILRDIRDAEANLQRYPHLRGAQSILAYCEDRLADFMYRNCGFHKGAEPPVRKWHQKTREEAQQDYIATILAIPL